MPRGSALKVVDDSYVDNKKDFELWLKELELWASDLPEEFLRCRELGHNWSPHTATKYRNAFVRTLRCPRCKTRKRQQLDSRGMIVGSPVYIHPEGYLHQGHGQIRGDGRGVLRIASMYRGRITEVDEDWE